MICRVRLLVAACFCCCLCAFPAFAQDDVIARARADAAAGRRADAIERLRLHLATSPQDVDARLVYGLVLSWDGKYDEARMALTEVLAAAPDYLDARVALMNVEWWSGRTDAARDQVRLVLARDPGNTQARIVRQRLEARRHPWSIGAILTTDSFNSDRGTWRESSITVGRETPVGSLLVRGSQADRFGLDDRQIDVELYPVFRAGTYAFVGVGFGDSERLYPQRRVSFDLYQSIANGYEISGGFRRLEFSNAATLYLASLSKYAGSWLLTAKASVVANDVTGNAWSYHGSARRYFGDLGTSFVAVGYSHGFSREEPRGAGDLLTVDADTFRGEASIDPTARLRFLFSASTSRQERALLTPLWQTTLSAGLAARF